MRSETEATRCNRGLVRALHVTGPAGEHAGKLMLFGRFVGSWHLEWTGIDPAGQPGTMTGELHFGWVLGGRAVRDIWLAIAAAGPGAAESRLAELAALQAGLGPGIQAMTDGPYLVTGVGSLVDWLGQPVSVRPQLALCRCGGSKIKPLCDGSHAATGFTAAKDPGRVPDRRDTHAGQQVTIFDNRGTCQHSGYCTGQLAPVFRQGQEPFVAPSGGRMDEIIRAVRDCPSGALRYGIVGAEARADADWHATREPVIEVTRDCPYRITGGIPLSDGQGKPEHRNAGASGEHYALCRCGHSQNKPFCSGMHWYVEFKDPVPDPDREPTVFEWAGARGRGIHGRLRGRGADPAAALPARVRLPRRR